MKEIGMADIHTHTMYSGFSKYSLLSYPDSVTTPRTLVKVAQMRGLDVLCVTDHNTIDGALKAKKYNKELVVVGEEISSKHGEIIGLFLQKYVKPGLSAEETIEQIHEQNGIAVAPHPFSGYCSCVGNKIHTLELDGIEVFNALHRDGYSNFMALKSCNGHAKLGGSDAHSSCMIGNGYTLFDGSSQEDFRVSINSKKTYYGGKVASLSNFIKYGIRVAFESSKVILNFNGVKCPMSARISRIKNSRKILYLLASTMYAFSPLPVACTIFGNEMLKKRGLKISLENSMTQKFQEDFPCKGGVI